MSCFLTANLVLCVETLSVIVLDNFLPGLNWLENQSEVEADLLALLKKQLEINLKKVFSTESKEQH